MGRNKRTEFIQNIVYKVIVKDCMDATKTKGETLAKKLAKKVAVQLLSDQQKLLYKTISKHEAKYPDGMPSHDVAYYTSLDPLLVSSQLGHIFRHTGLIKNVGEGKIKYWKTA